MISNVRWQLTTRTLLTAAIAGTAALFPGCSPQPKEAAAPVKQAEAPAPAAAEATPAPKPEAPKPLTAEALLERIAQCEKMVGWYRIRDEYRNSGLTSADIDAALMAKEKQLLAKNPPQAITDALELVDFEWTLLSTEGENGELTRNTATWLFKKKAAINLDEGNDVVLVLRGLPDKSHVEKFASERYRDQGFFEFTYDLDPGVQAWSTGEYHLVTKNTFPPVPKVPYRMVTVMSEVHRNDEGETRFANRFGERPQMGWFAVLR